MQSAVYAQYLSQKGGKRKLLVGRATIMLFLVLSIHRDPVGFIRSLLYYTILINSAVIIGLLVMAEIQRLSHVPARLAGCDKAQLNLL